ncbi:MAG: hypothetical protein QG553_39 [Patescibacteria group bacterium]|nr:hypothetical protein [Patescibacteria group bacterium]
MTEEIVTNKTILDAVRSIGVRVDDLQAWCTRQFAGIDQRFDAIDQRFDAIDQHLEQQDLRLSSLEHLVRNLGFEMSLVKKKVDEVDGRLMAVENDIKEIYFHWTFD